MKKMMHGLCIFSCIFLLIGCTSDNEKSTRDSEVTEAETSANEEDHTLKEMTLQVWSDAAQDNQTYTDTSSEDIRLFTELVNTLSSQSEDSDDIIVMGEDAFETVSDGVIHYDDHSLGFLYDSFHWKNELYENAWYVEFISTDKPVKGFLFPDGSKYIPILEELLENMHYEELQEAFYSPSSYA